VDTIVDGSGSHLIVSTGWDHKLVLWDLSTAQVLDEVSFREDSGDNSKSTESQVASSSSSRGANTDGDDMIPEKDYNEKDAGNYPFQVVSNTVDAVVVIFKDEPKFHVYRICDRKFHLAGIVPLSANPLDVQFIDPVTIFALLPKDHMLAVYNMNASSLVDISNFIDSTSFEMLQAKAGKLYRL
jgi:hypothetical protein